MRRQIVLTKTAEKRLDDLLKYLENNWSLRVKLNFLVKLKKRFEVLKNNPEVFPHSNIKKGLYKCVVTRQTTVYYTFDNAKVYILTVFDNRQDPKQLKKEIE